MIGGRDGRTSCRLLTRVAPDAVIRGESFRPAAAGRFVPANEESEMSYFIGGCVVFACVLLAIAWAKGFAR